MNRIERFFGLKGEARVRYLDGEYQVLGAGDFVRCAVTGEVIALSELKYWSVERQEAYANPTAALKRHQEAQTGGK
jgi:hypothetical protein